ncbi:MAG: DUF72 domain-containing protein [Bdellovibrionales bacterium]|nr:DUF72 domain-containing protein [Bdellovibrionales bacterium]
MEQDRYHLPLATKLPPEIHFGTSSWTYRGWEGLVYHQHYKSEKSFTNDSLGEYVAFPWFRTVGIDSFFYAPPAPSRLAHYVEQLPSDFRWVSKAWEQITIPVFGRHPRYGARAGKPNPDFLNADLFIEEVLSRFEEPAISAHTGPFVFQFQAFPQADTERRGSFFERLDTFLAALPTTFRYATEVRNSELLCGEYFGVLNRHRVTHCFNHWTNMPPLSAQMKAAAQAGGLDADFFVARILTPRGVSYQNAVKKFQPYRELKSPLPDMRRDVVRLAKRGVQRGIPVYVLVNNRAEGHAPGTIADIGRSIVDECGDWTYEG